MNLCWVVVVISYRIVVVVENKCEFTSIDRSDPIDNISYRRENEGKNSKINKEEEK